MAFVHVPHRRPQPERAQRTHAADAQDHFLADAHGVVTAIETMGGVAIRDLVLRAVGVEQDHADPPHPRPPQPRHDVAAGDRHLHRQPVACRVAHGFDRQVARILLAILGVLHAVAVHDLREVTLAVEQPDGDEIQPLVAGRLAVVAREHAEPTRVDREPVVEAVLGAEIRDQGRIVDRRRLHIGVEHAEHFGVARAEPGVGRRAVQGGLVEATQQQARIAARLRPERRVEFLEQRPGGAMPAEKQVVGEVREAREVLGNARGDLERQCLSHRQEV